MSSVNDILANLQQLASAIENVYTNFKKDGASRKTPDYVKKRLDILDNYWVEYESNYSKLSSVELDPAMRDHINSDLERVQERYGNIRAHIQSYQAMGEERAQSPLIKPPAFVQKPNEHIQSTLQPSSSRVSTHNATVGTLDGMLKKQQSNFKAFHRTITGIDLESVNEKWEFVDLLQTIQSRWTAIDSLHWELDSLCNEPNEEYEKTFSSYESKYQSIKKAINKKMGSLAHREKSTPQMEIPTFNGNYNNWVSFKDLFNETVHSNSSLSNAQKMQYLKSKVKGEAERLIQHLNISSDNYLVCWDILNQRYNNKKLIFSSHMNVLMNIPTMQHQSATHLKRIHDTIQECLNAIKNLGVDITSWDPIIIHLLTQKLDTVSYTDYMESVRDPREIPNLKEFLQFLEAKFTSLEASRRKQDIPTQKFNGTIKNDYNNISKQRPSYIKNSFASSKINSQVPINKKNLSAKNYLCALCNSTEHGIYFCPQFLEMPPNNKLKTVNRLNLCQNCLYNHRGQPCLSENFCRLCNKAHNRLLHEAFTHSARPTAHSMRGGQNSNAREGNAAADATVSADAGRQVRSSSHVSLQGDQFEVLLPTAIVKIKAADGTYYVMRALLDQGSQTSLITEHAAQILKIPRMSCKGVISGIGDKESNCKGIISVEISSTVSDFTLKTDALIMNQLIRNLPSYTFSKPDWSYLNNIKLADPEFYKSRPVDILLGADIYSIILMDGMCRSDTSLPTAQQTQLGWILSGNVRTFQCNVVLNNIEQIQKFWEIEDIADIDEPSVSTEDEQCIKFYQSTTKRREDGRYEVRLPLKPNYQEKLGHSKSKAVAQFYKLEQKLARNNQLSNDYKLFINEYLTLGHMTPADSDYKLNCYLPHHGVTRADSTTTKLRVVFNASEKTSTGFSLNDVMCRGPNLQQDLQNLLIKWRQHRYAFTADLEKMFRQIWLNKQDQDLQLIVWRDNQNLKLKEYKLATVTYGTKAAPFLAMMTLKQLASDEKRNYQESTAPFVLENSFYMDDLIHGSDSITNAKQLQNDLINLLKSGGFNLRKWKSNSPELLKNVDADQQQQDSFHFKQAETTKALGLRWCPQDDYFTFHPSIACASTPEKLTKRTLLSELSKLYDPLGWLAPFTLKLKILFQDVWKANILWDEAVPKGIYDEWQRIQEHLEVIGECQVPRWLQTLERDSIELHGFCDASTKAYAAVVYIKVQRENQSKVTLVAAKTKVVPLNKNTSVPRLELCGAVLLAKLIVKIKNCLVSHDVTMFAWVDSMAVLGWLNGDSSRWKAFVANRVKQVTESVPSTSWRYVQSKENPADCASRGLTAPRLKEHSLWWNGPSWLATYQSRKEESENNFSTDQELCKIKSVLSTQQRYQNYLVNELLTKYSSLPKAIRILGWIRRFLYRNSKSPYLLINELRDAKLIIIKQVQTDEFNDDIDLIKQGKNTSSNSKLYNLNPMIDDRGILRLTGRLRHANIDPEMKHPIIIPSKTRLADLIIDEAHKLTFHGGPRLTTAFMRQRYWMVGGIRAVKQRLRLCVPCRKESPSLQHQLMGDLPSARTEPSRPFYHCGVDYTGHVYIKANQGRGIKTTKGYIAVFVCMATKAVHLELVSSLTTSAFLAALRRMAARRGLPRHMYSDQGKIFIGADRILREELSEILETINPECRAEVENMGIEWHFNAPSWPSAGGLWEAAVKSLKHHLKRVINDQKLTYEEFTTLLSQLEGCLNSRPLCPLTEDPDDLDFLTPSHFLSSGPLLTLYETEKDLRTRWNHAQKIFSDLWSRWRKEYLTQLTVRSKWRKPQTNIKLNEVVIIKDENLPPGKWSLGRVVELHPGSDGYVRVVTLKTKNGLMKRPVVKLAILPVHEEQQQEVKQKENKPEKPKSETKNTRKHSFATIVTSLLFFFMTLHPAHCFYNVTPIQGNNSIYFDRIKDMQLIRDDWRLVVYYDTQPYQDGYTALNKYIQYLDGLCVILNKQSHCEGVLLQLRHEASELQYYNDLLINHNVNKRRRRRGLLNGVGNIANTLFGVLDDRFAEKYELDIQLIRENENHLASLWKNQTSIVEAEFNILKRTEVVMDQQHKLIHRKISSLENAVIQAKTELQSASVLNDFLSTAMITNNILFSLRNIQQTLLDAVTNVYNGRFNFHLIPPEQLRHELAVISDQVPNDLTLPITKLDRVIDIYNLLQVRARVTPSFVIFEIKIPLIGVEVYEVLKLIPIPRLADNNKEISVVPVSEYVAVNLKHDAFMKITQTDLNSCIQSSNSQITLCHLQMPIYIIKDDQDFCETHPTSRKCKTISDPCSNRWVELNKINKYFFFCCDKCQLKLICADQITPLQINNAGFFNIDQGCTIKTAHALVYSHRQSGNQIKLSSNIQTPEISQINHIINISLPRPDIEQKDNFDSYNHTIQLQEIEKNLEIMKNEEPLASRISSHDVHHYVAIYILFAVLGLGAALWAGRRCSRRMRGPAPAAPAAPREEPAVGFTTTPAPSTSSVQCSAVNELVNKSVRRSLKSKSVFAKKPSASSVSVQDTGSSPIVFRPEFRAPNEFVDSN